MKRLDWHIRCSARGANHSMKATSESRRHFIATFAGLGLGTTLMPGLVWAQLEEKGSQRVSTQMIRTAAAAAGFTFTDEEINGIVQAVNQNYGRYEALRAITIPNDVAPPFYFSPLVPGMKVDRTPRPFRVAAVPKLKRPANIEDLAFAPITHLAALLKARQVTSVELTEMYLGRLKKFNPKLNCVVTFLDDVALSQAKQADAEIAAGKYRGLLHGVPWGAKDIIAVKGYKTTWGSGAYKDQMIEMDATIVEILREAGAVLLAKLSTGELAGGDVWFGGRTNNPWNLQQGSSGSSAGPASATAAGCVPFAIGSETGGSILSPSSRCGCTGLRPTFGRVSRYGVMALSWTQDRLGPICRSVEDCAVVMNAIAKQDHRDLSVVDVPFNWDAKLDYKKLKVGYLKDAFDDNDRNPDWAKNEQAVITQLQSMGVQLVPLKTPDFPVDILSISVESAVFFDELLRSGRVALTTRKNRGSQFRSARLIPAVEYLQSQRLRSMMMQRLAEATAGVDVYLAPWTGGAIGADAPAPESGAQRPPPKTATEAHYRMANLACYPAVALPTGFAANGSPTSITFMGQPFKETEIMTLAKAYQDATGFHQKHPVLT